MGWRFAVVALVGCGGGFASFDAKNVTKLETSAKDGTVCLAGGPLPHVTATMKDGKLRSTRKKKGVEQFDGNELVWTVSEGSVKFDSTTNRANWTPPDDISSLLDDDLTATVKLRKNKQGERAELTLEPTFECGTAPVINLAGADGDGGPNGDNGAFNDPGTDAGPGLAGGSAGRIEVAMTAVETKRGRVVIARVRSERGDELYRFSPSAGPIEINANGGAGGPGGAGGTGGPGQNGAGDDNQCSKPSAGGDGANGGDGGDGGTGGEVTVFLDDAVSDLEQLVTVNVRGGFAGVAGAAGPGGDGGTPTSSINTDNGSVYCNTILENAPNGKDGKEGRPGRDGGPGHASIERASVGRLFPGGVGLATGSRSERPKKHVAQGNDDDEHPARPDKTSPKQPPMPPGRPMKSPPERPDRSKRPEPPAPPEPPRKKAKLVDVDVQNASKLKICVVTVEDERDNILDDGTVSPGRSQSIRLHADTVSVTAETCDHAWAGTAKFKHGVPSTIKISKKAPSHNGDLQLLPLR